MENTLNKTSEVTVTLRVGETVLYLQRKMTNKPNKFIVTNNRMVVTRGEGAGGENEEGKRGPIYGDGMKLDYRW